MISVRISLAFLFCFLIVFQGFGQSPWPEDLRENLKTAKNLSLKYPDSALFLAQQVLDLAKKTDRVSLIFEANRTLGRILEDNNRLSDARPPYQIALDLAEKRLVPDAERFKIYTDWAILHKKTGDYKTAHDYHFRCTDEAEKLGDWKTVEFGHHGLGVLYSYLSDFEKSAGHYFKSIEAAERWGNRRGVSQSQQNLANVFLKAKNHEMARKSIAEAWRVAVELNDSARLSAVQRIYGRVDLASGDPEAALEKFLAAKTAYERAGDRGIVAEIWLDMAKLLVQQKNFEQADAAFRQSLALEKWFSAFQKVAFFNELGKFQRAQNLTSAAEKSFRQSLGHGSKIEFREVAAESNLALAEIFSSRGQFENAYRHRLAADSLNQIIFEENRQKSLAGAQFKYDFEKQEILLQARNRELEHSKRMNLMLVGGFILSLGLLFFAFRQMRARQKSMQQIELLNKELHHRVKNNLQTISSIFRLQSRQIQEPAALHVLNESRQRLEAISMIHQQVFQNETLKTINFRQFATEMTEKLGFINSAEIAVPETRIRIEPENMDVDKALPFALILNELMTNSFKHAFPGMADPRFELDISAKKFHFRDNGKGFPEKIVHHNANGFGLQLIRSLAQQIGENPRFYNLDGAHFEMDIN